MPLGIDFGGGGKGGFDFGDFRGGSIATGPVDIDARTTTGGGDPEKLGQVVPLVLIIGVVVIGAMIAKRMK